MKDILGVDLNEIVSKQVAEKLSELEQTIEDQYETIKDLRSTVHKQSERLKAVENSESLLMEFKQQFNSLQYIKEDREKDIYEKSLSQVRYEFIQDILSNLFNIPKEGHIFRNSSWSVNLAIYYYEHKNLIISVLSCFGVEEKILTFIRQYKLPKDWGKEDVLEFVKNPKYCTNGAMFGNSQYWAGGKENLPYNWIMVNPIITEDDVFEELITSINQSRGQWSDLFAVYKYIKLSEEQKTKLGDTLLKISPKAYTDTIREFIRTNLTSFSKDVKDYLFQFCSDDNQFNLFHWQNFPVEYQQKYLLNKPTANMLSILTNYSCKWSEEEKEEFLKKRFNISTNETH